MMEMSKMVPQLLQDFDFSRASQQKSRQVKTFWFAKQSGLFIRIHRRTKKQVEKSYSNKYPQVGQGCFLRSKSEINYFQ